MKKRTIISILAVTGLFSCKQSGKSTPNTVAIGKGINTKYEYGDSLGNLLIIQNSLPKSRINYTDPNGKKYNYAVFWTQITNETLSPIELTIDFPRDSFEFPSESGNYMKLLVPSDTMTPDKESLTDYGLVIKSFLDNNLNESSSLKRTINPNGSTAFYVTTVSNHGVAGALRTALNLKGQNLVYEIARYSSTSRPSVIEKKEISSGYINLKDFMLRK